MAVTLRSVIPIWVIALAGAIVVGVLAAPRAFTWLPIVMAGCVLITFAIQLALQRREGLVTRTAASIGGALVILAVATAVLAFAR